MDEKIAILALQGAIRELSEAVKEMTREMTPNVPLPRPRMFQFTPNVYWPCRYATGVDFNRLVRHGGAYSIHADPVRLAELIAPDCEGYPARIRRAIRQIQAAAEWCRRRAEGRQRHAAEILRQQRKDVEWVEATAAMSVMQKIGRIK